ncbi:zinc finger BED domain-containing protein DAYSLEEPER-like [Cucumis melo var. makuwa]|uniref:Zinc finger BED domain-containing protein DAYSLEEPER-like n=1 Tax=Cucumis melo var. makuwa TaxID=1194695 RepID=A0A5D3BE31_CUCMM|nr:zinc finger BED domain-containing protein DAYSLEEPER-like [Cucumis melo var. makuwa]
MTFYSSKSSTKEEPQRSTSTSYLTSKRDGSSSKISLPNRKDRHLKFEEFVSNVENDVNNVKSKLDRYLDESLLPRTKDFNILQWWKLNGVKYNVLYEIAKDVLAVPITTVASESAFSIGGRHVGPHRSQIHENLLEALMCTQDWLWAEDKHTPIDAKVLENVLHDRDLDDDEPDPREIPVGNPHPIPHGEIDGDEDRDGKWHPRPSPAPPHGHLYVGLLWENNGYHEGSVGPSEFENKKRFTPDRSRIVVHLAVHLPYEEKVTSLINYNWMYLNERSLCTLKHYVWNKARPEGSIIETYVMNESRPSLDVQSYTGCIMGGIQFHTIDRDFQCTTQNSRFMVVRESNVSGSDDNNVYDIPKVDDVEDQQLNIPEIVFGHRGADHVEDGTLCRVDIYPTVVERSIVRHVVDDFINDDDEQLSVQSGSSDDKEQ